MRHIKPGPLLLALTLALPGLAIGCGRNPSEQDDKAAVERPAPAEEPTTFETQDPEVTPQRVEIAETEPGPDRGAELDVRERQLAQRQADLEARERRLRSVTLRPEKPSPRTKPAPVAPVERPAPAPVEDRTEETEEVADLPAPAPEPEPERAAPAVTVATVPSGTPLAVEFLESLSSQTSKPGDIFRARVASDVTDDGGRVVIPAGSEVVGVVGEAVPLRKVGGQAKLTLKFTDLVLPSGGTVPIHASFVGQGRSETRKDAATIGGAAAGGAILGRVLGKGNRSKGAVIGAIIGAAAGTAIASRTPGEEVTIARGTVVDLKLDDEVEVRVRR
jgi:hypothetical protein